MLIKIIQYNYEYNITIIDLYNIQIKSKLFTINVLKKGSI